MDEDVSRLKAVAVNILNEVGCNGSSLSEDMLSEMCRFGGAELHVVGAIIGGIASQEAIKVIIFHPIVNIESRFSDLTNFHSMQLITQQFVPLQGTYIFNGIDHKSQLLEL